MKAPSLLADTLRPCALAGAGVVVAATAAGTAGLPCTPPIAVALFAVVGAIVVHGQWRHGAGRRFGSANRVTLTRAAMTSVLAGFIPEADLLDPSWRLALSLAAAAALLLDGLDGRLARRHGTATRFGARFDMEIDALAALVLSLLVFRTGQAGAWVILLGAARYLYVLAGLALPALAAEPPPSVTRKAICVVMLASLVVSLSPLLPGGIAAPLCAGAGFLLIYSFAIDCILLLRGAASRVPAAPAS
jgi:phosphatidylglycerophosphate synthase